MSMDPNATLAEVRGIVASVRQSRRNPDGVRLAELVGALDDWLTRGGFLPTEWHPHLSDSHRKRNREVPCYCGPGNINDYDYCPRHRPFG